MSPRRLWAEPEIFTCKTRRPHFTFLSNNDFAGRIFDVLWIPLCLHVPPSLNVSDWETQRAESLPSQVRPYRWGPEVPGAGLLILSHAWSDLGLSWGSPLWWPQSPVTDPNPGVSAQALSGVWWERKETCNIFQMSKRWRYFWSLIAGNNEGAEKHREWLKILSKAEVWAWSVNNIGRGKGQGLQSHNHLLFFKRMWLWWQYFTNPQYGLTKESKACFKTPITLDLGIYFL